MKIIRLRLSKAHDLPPRPVPKRWIAAVVRSASETDFSLFDRRGQTRPEALSLPRFRYARSA